MQLHEVQNHYPESNIWVKRSDDGRWQVVEQKSGTTAVVDFGNPGAPIERFPTTPEALAWIEQQPPTIDQRTAAARILYSVL